MTTDEIRTEPSPAAATTAPRHQGESGIDSFYPLAEFNQRLDLLQHLLLNSDRVLLARGGEGVGKSTLITRLQQQKGHEWLLCRIDATPMLQPDQLFSLLAQCFDVPEQGDDLAGRLQVRFDDLYQNTRLPVILVDDAHLLPIASLAALLRLQTEVHGGAAGVRIVLFALPQIADLLHGREIRSLSMQPVQVLELQPLNHEQTGQLAEWVLQSIRGGPVALNASEIVRIYRDSGGLPGKIIQQVKEIGAAHMQDNQAPAQALRLPSLFADLSGPVVVGGLLLGLMLLLTLIYQDEINALFEGNGGQVPTIETTSIDSDRIVPLQIPRLPPVQEEVKGTTDAASQAAPETGDSAERKAAEIGLPAGVVTGEEGAITAGPASPVAVDSVVSPPREAETVPAGEESGVAAPQPAEEVVEGKLVPEPPTPEPAAPRHAPVAAEAEPPREGRSVTQAPAVKPEKAPVEEAGIRREAWLLQQDPKAYSLQLVAFRDEKAIAAFVRQQQLKGDLAYFQTLRNGTPWYSLLYGVYPSKAAAKSALDQLPGKLRKRVWIRSLASVQKAIKGK